MIDLKKNNIYKEELTKFSEFAEDWWNPGGNMKLLHLVNPTRLKYIEQQTFVKDKYVLDVGCGGGLLSEALAKRGAIVTAIDVSKPLIVIAKNHAEQQQLNIDYQCQDIDTLTKEVRHFDIITCIELLEHVPDPQRMIKNCATLLKRSGKLFFSTINRNFKVYLYAIIGAEYLFNLLPKGTHDYGQLIRPSELMKWTESAGLRVSDITGMHYHPFKREFDLSRDVSVNYLMCSTHE